MTLFKKLCMSIFLLFVLLLLLLAGPAYNLLSGEATLHGDWSKASRQSAGIAPDPSVAREAIVQVYAARAFRWRGAFAVHTWIALKPKDAEAYRTFEVVRWYIDNGDGAVISHEGRPDRYWYGARPTLLTELTGDAAERAIPKIRQAIASYPYKGFYRSWPGPNSNTFTAYVLRSVPEIATDLPPTAIGKDFIGPTTLFARAPSRSGFQFSVFGVLGALVSLEEGLEFNLLGLSFGVDPGDFALRVPGIGILGP